MASQTTPITTWVTVQFKDNASEYGEFGALFSDKVEGTLSMAEYEEVFSKVAEVLAKRRRLGTGCQVASTPAAALEAKSVPESAPEAPQDKSDLLSLEEEKVIGDIAIANERNRARRKRAYDRLVRLEVKHAKIKSEMCESDAPSTRCCRVGVDKKNKGVHCGWAVNPQFAHLRLCNNHLKQWRRMKRLEGEFGQK